MSADHVTGVADLIGIPDAKTLALRIWNYVIDEMVADVDARCEVARLAALAHPDSYAVITEYNRLVQLRGWVYGWRVGGEPGDVPLRQVEDTADISTVNGDAPDRTVG